MINCQLPIHLASMANLRLHWASKARIAKRHRAVAKNSLSALAAPLRPPLSIVLTRVAPRKLDGDNLQYAFKAIRDGVADWLGVDDGSPQLDWQYAQRSAGPGQYWVEIDIQ
jgi:hypothetical protein